MFRSALRATTLGCALLTLVAVAPRAAGEDKKPEEKKVELQVGDAAPKFDLRTDQDKTWASADHVGKKWVVIYFYPGDFTPGCTAQANLYREAMNKLTELGVEVVGVSGDSVKSHDLFKKAQKLNFTLLADEEGKVAKLFGVPFGKGGKAKGKDVEGQPIEVERAGTAARWTFIIGKDGKVAHKNIKVIPAQDAKAIVEFIGNADKK